MSLRLLFFAIVSVALIPNRLLFAQGTVSLPEGKGKSIVARTCTQCHGLENITQSSHDRDEWNDVLEEMVGNGAQLTDDEIEIVSDYLAQNFGPSKASSDSKPAPDANSPNSSQAANDPSEKSRSAPQSKVNVNEATAQELQSKLQLPQQQADAIISYRKNHGKFANWEELAKVPGIDADKLKNIKDRVVFE